MSTRLSDADWEPPGGTGIRIIDEPDWAPPGGTSSNRWREIAKPLDEAFHTLLTGRIAQDSRLWMKTYNDDTSLYVGWRDDPRGSYYVGFGLEHDSRRAEDRLRSFLWLQYRHEGDQGFDREDRVGETWFEPPYARDLELRLHLMMAWLDAHRRTLTTLEPQCRHCDQRVVPDAVAGWRHDAAELDDMHDAAPKEI